VNEQGTSQRSFFRWFVVSSIRWFVVSSIRWFVVSSIRWFVIAFHTILSYVLPVNRLLLILFCCATMTGWSCGDRNDYTPTEADKRIIRAYASLALLYDSFPSTQAQDSVAIYGRKADSVLTEFGLSRDEFRREFENLINTPERFQPLFQELSSEIQKEMQKRR